MTSFHISALPAEDLHRIRGRGTDDFGNDLVVTVQDEAGAPLRCCLRDATIRERIALIAWRPAQVGGAYAEVGPIFIHAEPCSGYDKGQDYPEGFRSRRQLFRAYDVNGWQVDNRIVEGYEAEAAIADLFADPQVSYLHSRNLLAGCYMFTITRADSAA